MVNSIFKKYMNFKTKLAIILLCLISSAQAKDNFFEEAKKLFENKKYDLGMQYQLKGILKQIGRVTNLAEDVADAVLILATKHST